MSKPPQSRLNATIYHLVRQVPRGRVTTYGAIAQALGMPHGARQVGWAMAALDEDEVPAHRVVDAHGGVRGGWTADVRRAQLADEGVTFDAAGRVRLAQHLWEPDPPCDAALMANATAAEQSDR